MRGLGEWKYFKFMLEGESFFKEREESFITLAFFINFLKSLSCSKEFHFLRKLDIIQLAKLSCFFHYIFSLKEVLETKDNKYFYYYQYVN